MWSLAPLIAFAAEIHQGVGWESAATLVVGVLPLTVFSVSFLNKKSDWKLHSFDLVCGGLSILGLVLWIWTKVGNLAILFSILADGIAGLPTIAKSFSHPESENDLVYLGSAINGGVALLAVHTWNFQNYAFPAYLLIVYFFTFLLIRFRLGKILKND